MYPLFNKSNFLIVLMVFSAMTYLSLSYGSEYQLIVRGERFEGREGRGGGERFEGREGGFRGGEGFRGDERMGGSYNYRNYGRSYTPEARAGAWFGAGAAAGAYNNQGNEYYPYPVDTYQPNSQPIENYQYYQQPY